MQCISSCGSPDPAVSTASQVFRENLVRGRGLFCRSMMKSQLASPAFSPVYAGGSRRQLQGLAARRQQELDDLSWQDGEQAEAGCTGGISTQGHAGCNCMHGGQGMLVLNHAD